MIKIDKKEVTGWESAIRGMRNAMNSWDKSDTGWVQEDGQDTYIEIDFESLSVKVIGENDLALMKKLVKAGSDHSKFMRMIHVTCDVTAPLYWWKEADTYKVGTTANSTSTMHKIHAKEFVLEDFSHEHLLPSGIENLWNTICTLNDSRKAFNETKDKAFWWNMIQLLPTSYNQLRTLDLNYQVLRNIYHARKHHKLDEWREFCAWIEGLPYAKELICGE